MLENLPTSAGDTGLISGLEDPLEKDITNHSSILAWKILQTGEGGGLQSIGSRRVGHNLATKQQQYATIDISSVYFTFMCFDVFYSLHTFIRTK